MIRKIDVAARPQSLSLVIKALEKFGEAISEDAFKGLSSLEKKKLITFWQEIAAFKYELIGRKAYEKKGKIP